MFRVDNADFIANKLATELLPDQEQREAFVNAHEAVTRRMLAEGIAAGGRIELDVDWHLHQLDEDKPWFISCSDNGDGMSRVELEKYMTTLAVVGANQNQSIIGNQGMGLKISGPTRHKRGVLIRSMKNGERSMVQVGWDGKEYGLIPLGEHGELVVSAPESAFPVYIAAQGSGTVVTFLGNEPGDNTFLPPGRIGNNWLFKYMNVRFFHLSHDGIEVVVRVPSGDESEWPGSPEEASERQRGKGKSFNFSGVEGTGAVWTKASKKLGDEFFDVMDVPGIPSAGNIPPAKIHWWILPSKGSDVSSRTNSGGSLAIAYQNELHDWRTTNQANPFLARMGVLFGKNRFAFVVEPTGPIVTSDFARAHVLIDGKPVLETGAWLVWADQFRENMPEKIRETMHQEQEQLQEDDPDRARRIKDRLKDVMQLLRPKRARPSASGAVRAAGPSVTGPGDGSGTTYETPVGPREHRPKTTSPRGVGAVLAIVADEESDPATEVFSMLSINPKWVSEEEAENVTIVNGNGRGLRDRAAALGGEDGATAEVLLLNHEFRGYQSIVAAVNEWGNPDGDGEIAAKIETFTREWIEQKMVEAVVGLRQLENGSTWTAGHFDDALSPVALTAAFMADRWHTLREVKRQAGPLRRQPAATDVA